MADPKKPSPAQPAPLPRSWKATLEPAEAESARGAKEPTPAAPAPRPEKKKGKKKAATTVATDGGPKLEETPLLDTFEARQRVRVALGAALGLVALIGVLVLASRFGGGGKSDPANEGRAGNAPADPNSGDREAAILVENARQADKLGRSSAAIANLQKVVKHYAGTEAARIAAAALDRERRNRPLFEVEPAKAPKPPAATSAATVADKAATPAPTTAPVAPTPAPTPPPPRAPEVVARPLPAGYRAESSAPLHPTGWPARITCDRDGSTLILVPGGEFLMGREDGDPAERPPHPVRLGTFYIDEHEVTNRQYQHYLKESGRAIGEAPRPIEPERLDLPVVAVTALEARAYCYWANRRLPTEAQWELAARSADGRVSYGLKPEAPGPRTLVPVMSAPADRAPTGGFDFAGNAWEWTSDYYDARFYSQARGVWVDPTGPAESRIKPAQLVVKGGSKQGYLTWREGVRVEGRMAYLGFRGALTVESLARPGPGTPSAEPAAPGAAPAGGAVPF